jgi:hypothetical protein
MNVYRRAVTLAAVCAAALLLAPLQAQQGFGQQERGNGRFHRHPGKKIPNNYIVVFDQDATPDGDEAKVAADADDVILKTQSGRVRHVFSTRSTASRPR